MPIVPCLTDVPECPSPRRFLFGRRLVELTNRDQLLTPNAPRSHDLCSRLCTAANTPGFLQEKYDENPRIQQQVTPLSSKDYLTHLSWTECAVVRSAANSGFASDAGSNEFKRALQDLAIRLSGAHGSTHTVFVKWRSAEQSGGTSTTLFNIGFYPAELKEVFVKKARANQDTPRGFTLLDHVLQVSDVVTQQGFRFFVPVPVGWSDETMLQAMVEQAGLDPDHVLTFGYDTNQKASCNAPSGDMFFNFAPAGCTTHGATEVDDITYETTIPILQPPSRFFLTLPDGPETHVKVRKAGAWQVCWDTPGRHSHCIYNHVCKMCLVRYDAMEGKGIRHACGQGDLYREKPKSAFNPNMDAKPVREESSTSRRLKERMAENIERAKLKRAYADVEPDADEAALNDFLSAQPQASAPARVPPTPASAAPKPSSKQAKEKAKQAEKAQEKERAAKSTKATETASPGGSPARP